MTSIEGAEPVRPVYIFARPPVEVAHRIVRQRRLLGIGAGYAADRLHVTLLRLGECDALPLEALALIERTVAALRAEPVDMRFGRVRGNALRGATTRDVKALQKQLASALTMAGLALPHFNFDPHLTLVYDRVPRPSATITPIGWRVEEITLVVSHHGQGRHEVLCRWPLIARQFALPFAA